MDAEARAVSGKRLVAAGAVGAALVIAVIVLAFGRFGRTPLVRGARLSEGRGRVTELAYGVIACVRGDAATREDLPPSSRAVPEAFAATSGDGYASAPADWSDPAFVCAGFAPRVPQHVQYQWVLRGAGEGVALGRADADGDGFPDTEITIRVRCPPRAPCTATPLEQRRLAP